MKKRKAPPSGSLYSLPSLDDETLQAMLRQEALYDCSRTRTYTCNQYLDDDDENHQNRGLVVVPPTAAPFSRCVQSMMKVFQLCQLKHLETVVYAATYLHRCLPHSHSHREDTTTTSSSSLWALVCLYVAIKIHEPAALPLKTLPDLYQRFFCDPKKKKKKQQHQFFSLEDFKACELQVYRTLDWKLYPPTATDFVRQLLNGYGCSQSAVVLLLERAFQQEPRAYVQDHRPSILAMAALCLQGTCKNTNTTTGSISHCDTMDTLVEQQLQVLNHHHHYPTDCSSSWREMGEAMGFLARIQQLQQQQQQENVGTTTSTSTSSTGKTTATKNNNKKKRHRSRSSSISNAPCPEKEHPPQPRKKLKTSTHNEYISCQRSPRSALLMTSSVSSESLLSAAETSSY